MVELLPAMLFVQVVGEWGENLEDGCKGSDFVSFFGLVCVSWRD
jgi:hypothetical protein